MNNFSLRKMPQKGPFRGLAKPHFNHFRLQTAPPLAKPYFRQMLLNGIDLNADELYQRYREEQDPIKRTHLQILWLLTSGRPAKVAAEMAGYSQRWISVLVGRYNEAGVDGLGDLRRFNPGSRPLLDAAKLEHLDRALDHPPPDGGLWTGWRAAQWMCGRLGRLVSPRRGREYLRRLGFTRQVPRPRHAQGNFAAQERFKADFRARMEDLARADPDRAVEV